MILDLCRQFHCLPSQIRAEGAELIRMLTIESLGRPEERAGEGGPNG